MVLAGGFAGGSPVSPPQHEDDSVSTLDVSMLGHDTPLSHRPHGPAMGAAIASPGRSSVITTRVRRSYLQFMPTLEQYLKVHHSVKVRNTYPNLSVPVAYTLVHEMSPLRGFRYFCNAGSWGSRPRLCKCRPSGADECGCTHTLGDRAPCDLIATPRGWLTCRGAHVPFDLSPVRGFLFF